MATLGNHHPLVELAIAAITAYIRDGRVLAIDEAPQPVEGQPAGVFVTLHTRSTGDLRGCIGPITPCTPSLAEETVRNAISAATQDPRFEPVRREELADLVCDVSVLHPAEPIESIEALDPRRYGVIVRRGSRRGLLLPDIPGIDDIGTQVALARQKARIGPHEPVELSRFQVDKYT